ncbi:MAG: Hsp20/alpha crystallin family protein [Thermoguttaceae bacterium]|jgi:HSP20 family protein
MGRKWQDVFPSLFTAAAEMTPATMWRPLADIYRTSRGWLVKFELAGVRPEEIQLTACGQSLTLRGVRRDVRIEEGQCSYSMEISYNRFERTLELPCEAEALTIRSDYRDGMLMVWLEGACP